DGGADLACHASEVGTFHVGVDVEHGLNIVVADGAELGAGYQGSDVAEDLDRLRTTRCGGSAGSLRGALSRGGHGSCRAGDGKTRQVGEGIEAILRRLHGNAV